MKTPLENFDYTDEPAYTGISKAAAKDLADRYKKECQPLLTSRMPDSAHNKDARSIVFPIEQLKKMIWEIESNTRNLNTNCELGIRMYYGKYPDIAAIQKDANHPLHNDYQHLPADFSHHHTIFLVPVYKDDNNIDHDFDPWQAAATGVLQALDLKKDDHIQNDSPMTAQMNHGNICPPPFNVNDPDNHLDGMSF